MFQRKVRLFAALICAVVLTACSHPQLIDLGQSQEVVQNQLGKPDTVTPMPDGTVRWTYSSQPFGQQVWWLFFDQNQKMVAREQGLQEKYFPLVKIGQSTEADVWALWGACAEKYEFRLVGEHAWMYRYKDGGNFDMAVWPQFDKNGIVRSMDITPDPWKDRDRFFPWCF